MPTKISLPTNFSDETSWSSNSEVFENVDGEKSSCPVNEQWDAIERTLYEEEGDHVKDPKLLKECKLWKEAFPHLRVRGTKIEFDRFENIEEKAIVKKVAPSQNQVNINKTCDKTENIKNRIVGEIVQRLITRLKNQNKLNYNQKTRNPSYHTHEVFQNYRDLSNVNNSKSVLSIKSSNFSQKNYLDKNYRVEKIKNEETLIPSSERESYFERGKINKPEKKNKMSLQKVEERISEIFDSWEEDDFKDKNQSVELNVEKSNKIRVNADKNLKTRLLNEEKINMNNSMKQKYHKNPCHRDSLDPNVRPFELTKKIDKKYEALLNKIMERTSGASDLKNVHCQNERNTAKLNSSLPQTYLESLENIRIKSGYNELYKRSHQNLPKINATNMHNKWLEKNKMQTNKTETDFQCSNKSKYCFNPEDSIELMTHNYFPETFKRQETDEKFIQELKAKVQNRSKAFPAKYGTLNGMRSKPLLTLSQTKESLKSSSCEDLLVKNKKVLPRGPQFKRTVDNSKKDASFKNKTKFKTTGCSNYKNRSDRNSGSLPPIETGIICKELGSHLKTGPKTSFKGNK